MTASRGPMFRGRSGLAAEVVKPKNPRQVLRRLWPYLRPYRQGLSVVVIASLMTTLLSLTGPYLIGQAVDQAILPGNLARLVRITGLMLAIYLINTALTWLQNHTMVGISSRAVEALRNDLYRKMLRLPISFFDRTPTGELMSRTVNDVQNISGTLSMGALQLVSGSLSIASVVTVMFVLNWRLALVTTLTVPVVFMVIGRVASGTRKNFKQQQEDLGRLNSHIEENITGFRVVQAYGQEPRILEQFRGYNQALSRSAFKAQVYSGIIGPLMSAVNNVSYAVVVGFGGWLAVMGLASVGTLASFVNYSRQFSRPVNQIAALYNATQSAIAGAERVFELMDEADEYANAPENPPTASPSKLRGVVTFSDVNFGYTPERPVLSAISLNAQSGETIAIVGPTGSGKTTLINLLARFYDPQAGAITIDGSALEAIDRRALRARIGVVLQDTWLFSGTVMENIRYGRLDASDQEVMAAARMANAETFIHRMPQGFDTLLTEEGSNLSQGQRQMIAIARAILANPDILILDEATSNVDTRTEVSIQAAMRRLMTGRTSFVIAHRLRTIINADSILYLEDGRIVEQGTHDVLLSKQGAYHRLYHLQFDADN